MSIFAHLALSYSKLVRLPILLHFLQTGAFAGGYIIFAGLGTLSSLLTLPLSYVFRGRGAHRFGQYLIYVIFKFFLWYLRLCRLIRFNPESLQTLKKCEGLIIVANHPCLLDVVFITSQLPRVCCLMKASLAKNPVFCGTSRLAGYVKNQSGANLVHECRARLIEGGNLLIFPEGTRTKGAVPNEFKLGFALIAKQAQSPVQTILIEASSDYLRKGWPFLKMPTFPLEYSIRLGLTFIPTPDTDTRQFGKTIQQYFHDTLGILSNQQHEV